MLKCRSLLARTRTTVRITKKHPCKAVTAHINMASHNNQVIQVRFKPTYSILYPSSVCHSCPCKFITCQAQLTTIRTHTPYMLYKKLQITAMGPNLQFEIVKKAKWPPICMRKNLKANLLLTLNYAINLTVHDHNQDMADSSSPIKNKCGQLTI